MRKPRREGASDRAYKWKLEWMPLAILAVLFFTGAAITAVGLVTLSPSTYDIGNLLTGVLAWAVFFWIVLYAGIEYIVWRRTRNLGHRLQFLGAALLAVSPLELWVPIILGGWPAVFTPAGLLAAFLWMVTFFLGIALALIGYYARRFRAGDVAMYRNLIVREGERIWKLTDGYTDRTLLLPYPDLDGVDLRTSTLVWAAFLGRAGLSLGHSVDERGITVRPSTYTGIGTLRLWTAFVHAYWLLRHPERLTWVRIGWDRQVEVHVSRYDYERVGRPVAHHSLAAIVADALITSLLAFVRGDRTQSVALAAGQFPAPRRIRMPAPWHDRAGLAATMVAALLVIAGLGSAFTAAFTSPAHVALGIADVEFPSLPAPGAPVDVYARLNGVDEFWDSVESFYIHFLSYFNQTDGGTLYMRHVEGDTYGVRLGPFPEGTEVRFDLSASVRQFSSPPGNEVSLTAGPFTMTVGRVVRGGASGLAIGPMSHEVAPDGNVTFRVPVTSSAAITTAQLVTVIGFVVYPVNLTPSGGNMFEAIVPYLAPSGEPMLVKVLVAAQDATWNSATMGLVNVEVSR